MNTDRCEARIEMLLSNLHLLLSLAAIVADILIVKRTGHLSLVIKAPAALRRIVPIKVRIQSLLNTEKLFSDFTNRSDLL